MNNAMSTRVFRKNQRIGGSQGPSQPPKYSAVIRAETREMPMYSLK
jgi:hypothetical protein